MKLSNQPPKGMADWLPDDFRIRKYIFDIWRQVCESYGYQEYLTPLVEPAELYRAKSGEDVGGRELLTFTDQGGRELSIRPEMTPSVTRLVSRIYEATPKPIRYFSIANFMRNEKPQRGRNREFWQLNCDIFGSDSLLADLEIMQIALDIMLALGAPKNSFELGLNHRQLIDEVLVSADVTSPEKKLQVARLLDKKTKLSVRDFQRALADLGLKPQAVKRLIEFVNLKSLADLSKYFPDLRATGPVENLMKITKAMDDLGYGSYVKFQPSIIRGFDYYDGLVFEVFDKHPDNNRAMFGGGRYNGLAGIFGGRAFPAVGFAPGDEPTKLFLESWGLLNKINKKKSRSFGYLPLLDKTLEAETRQLAQQLRRAGELIELGLEEQSIGKALDYANKHGLAKVIIFGSAEMSAGIYKIKDMTTGKESRSFLKRRRTR